MHVRRPPVHSGTAAGDGRFIAPGDAPARPRCFHHVRGDAWGAGITEDWNDAGLSSARFDIPESRRVIVVGGSLGADPHYCVRIIRVGVKEVLR